jgi:uncharacterized protein (DUF427 family)
LGEWTSSEEIIVAEAKWNGQVIANSDATIRVEGNHYFPPESVDPKFLQSSAAHTVCPWKGTASYYDVVVEGEVAQGAAWFYPDPKPAASDIKGYIAFWRGVRVK